MKIAIDAMGGDQAPQVIVEGVEMARDHYADIEFLLYGKEKAIRACLKDDRQITIIHTDEKIESDDEPVRAVRRKKQASMMLAAKAVKDGEADALFSAGNTGALLAAGLLVIGRIKGIDRPGLTLTLPVLTSNQGFVFLDAGANAENKPENLQQYAILGTFYAKKVRGISQPTVGLLNNGTEASKGSELTKQAFALLEKTPGIKFVGNVEARDLLKGVADVVVTDGFTGNAVLKTIEGTALSIMKLLKGAIYESGLKGKIGGLMLKDGLTELKNKLDYSEYGGAVLLGIKAPVVKTHGATDKNAVYQTIGQIREMVNSNLIPDFVTHFEQLKINEAVEAENEQKKVD